MKIELSRDVVKDLRRIDAPIRARIVRFLKERVEKLDDPRAIGEPLKGPVFGELWKYRCGDYRILSRIEDQRLVVLVLRIRHRRNAYKE